MCNYSTGLQQEEKIKLLVQYLKKQMIVADYGLNAQNALKLFIGKI